MSEASAVFQSPEAFRGIFPALRDTQAAYLNSAFTSLVPEPVLEAQRTATLTRWEQDWAAYEAAIAGVAAFLNAEPEELILTSGTSEGLRLAASHAGLREDDRVVLSAAEHKANLSPWAARAMVDMTGLDASGCVDWNELESRLEGARVLALTHASNVTGEITPVARLAAQAHEAGALVVLDAAQSAPHLPLDVKALGVDLLAFSGHKVLGPSGIGVLWGRAEVLERLQLRRGEGMPPFEGVVALAAALRVQRESLTPPLLAHREALMRELDEGLRRLAGVRLLGPGEGEPRIPLYALGLAEADPFGLADQLKARGLWVRGGRHHAEWLHAMLGLAGSLRISLQTYNTLDEVRRLLVALEALLIG